MPKEWTNPNKTEVISKAGLPIQKDPIYTFGLNVLDNSPNIMPLYAISSSMPGMVN
ncbi:MAG TPA: hypothetical protein PK209_03280 [Saprospiraceae bacterium]|nr:hypothetical protein [Saprospiraceae bacterium]